MDDSSSHFPLFSPLFFILFPNGKHKNAKRKKKRFFFFCCCFELRHRSEREPVPNGKCWRRPRPDTLVVCALRQFGGLKAETVSWASTNGERESDTRTLKTAKGKKRRNNQITCPNIRWERIPSHLFSTFSFVWKNKKDSKERKMCVNVCVHFYFNFFCFRHLRRRTDILQQVNEMYTNRFLVS